MFIVIFTCKINQMRRISLPAFVLTLLLCAFSVQAQEEYSRWFTGEQLRYDFLLAGNDKEMRLFPMQMSLEPQWGGSRTHLTDTGEMGTYRYRVSDAASGQLLFSRGFCTLFQEWQSTAEARTTDKAYYHAVFFPFPKGKVKLAFEFRNYNGEFLPVFETVVDPADYFIHRTTPSTPDKMAIVENGDPATHADLLFLSEGYTPQEREKFFADAQRMADAIFAVAPYSGEKGKFNVNALFVASPESGTDVPGEHIYHNTLFNSTFYTFDIDRYLTTSDMKSIYDAASAVAWDHIILVVNTTRYGGGGFYNFLTVCTSDHPLTPKVLVHELGHGLAGLADEYYNSEVAYENYYNPAIEPWEPNITTLTDFPSKWKHLVDASTPVPTPREPQYAGVMGAFEGGGYMAKGMFSPMQDCLMKSNTLHTFCPVCREAIRRAIDLYAQ